ncbi:hypothetical protein VCSRO208_3486 [Vibrio cholerae]|nr:hypothetical protein [Vibrio cholerae]EGR1913150.1 hypothetical protein [Vibrio cholerae]EGR4325454.1 hypothetical protein [Vibrio cholerae]EKF9132620.1 hypothetical protein [Vibrio cholerae]EKO5183634.1 hypothetical protein [Vibrio cholerae]
MDKKAQVSIEKRSDKVAEHASMSYQPSLFPIEIVETYPSNQGSADLSLIGKGRDGKHYAIKTLSDNGGFVPASEFFCHHLARLVSIPTPSFEFVQLEHGEIAFGSVWEGGVSLVRTYPDMYKILQGDIVVEDLDTFLGKVYGFDLFVNNEDRHFGNYIFRESFNNTKIGLAFDFGRAWKETDPLGYECLEPGCNTSIYNKIVRKEKRYDKFAANQVLEKIAAISKEDIEVILSMMHDSWMTQTEKQVILDWWGSTEFVERIEKLKGAI